MAAELTLAMPLNFAEAQAHPHIGVTRASLVARGMDSACIDRGDV
jgi:hypothetical protein